MAGVPSKVTIVLPVATDYVLLASENISDNLRQGQASNIEMPSLYRRAYMLINETNEIGIVRQSGSGS